MANKDKLVIDGCQLCSKCGKMKPFNEFFKDRHMKYGHKSECKECSYRDIENAKKYMKGYSLANRSMMRKNMKEYSKRLKQKLVDGYGGQCECCGQQGIPFLTIDHIYNDGHKDSKNGHNLYRQLIEDGFPRDRYQLLCWNCNMSKRFIGACFHDVCRMAWLSCLIHEKLSLDFSWRI